MQPFDKWHTEYLLQAKFISRRSKDPRKKVGAVVTSDTYVVGEGFNGFPRGIEDAPHRLNNKSLKNLLMIHAEDNALWLAGDRGDTIYVYPCLPCSRCLGLIIRAKIKTIVVPTIDHERESSWGVDLVLELAREAGIQIIEIDLTF